MIKVTIPIALQPHVDNQAEILLEQVSNVEQALDSLAEKYPEFGKRLYNAQGEVNRFINLYVDDEDIRFLQHLQTPLSSGQELAIIPAIAGG